MVANVHAGEMIVPAQGGLADNFRSALANGGGGDTHYHFSPQVSAIDRNGVSNFFGNNSGHMLKAFNDAVGRGDHLGFRPAVDPSPPASVEAMSTARFTRRGSGSTLFVAAKPRFSFPGPRLTPALP